jgi:uncharacterized protein with GYD domain
MLSYYYLYEARQRLDNAKKTIEMMGGEHSCQPMLLGQRDMIELEVEYYKGEADKFTLILLTFAAFCGIMVVIFMKGLIHVW